jgi:hypothetical protein
MVLTLLSDRVVKRRFVTGTYRATLDKLLYTILEQMFLYWQIV